jgi:CubicO group peptidase (beta-lactamase class C family)
MLVRRPDECEYQLKKRPFSRPLQHEPAHLKTSRLDARYRRLHNAAMSTPRDELLRTLAAIESGTAAGLHIGAQMYVWQAGRIIADFAIGESRPGVAMTTDTLMLWLSATKPITAVCVAQLWERGRLRLDDRVAQHIPEFGINGKEAITIRHLLTHTAGIRAAASNWGRSGWDETIARICAAKIEPQWVPGRKAGYHVASTWFILGELVRRLDGRPLERYVREEIFLPLGMNDSWIGLPPEQYAAYGDRIGIMQNTGGGEDVIPHSWDTPETSAMCKPGGNGRGPIRELARFYEMLLNGGSLDGATILSPQTVEAMTARHRVGMFDHTFKHVMDWGLGLIPNNNQYGVDTIRYGYGPHASWRTFGHSGHQSSVAFADPKHQLVVAVVFNGTPGEVQHDQRIRSVLTALYEDLHLVPSPSGRGPG